jgi:hypothetical protein
MEHACAIKLDRRGQEKQSPLASGAITGPHRLHQEGFGGIVILDQTHENNAKNESRNGDDNGKYESTEEVALLTDLH